MSNMSYARDKLATKLENLFPGKYNIYKSPQTGGYTAPFIVLNSVYNQQDPDTTTNSKRIAYSFETLIGIEYNGCTSTTDELTKEEELEADKSP